MKYFIVQEEFEYTIFKVTDNLIEDFKIKMEKSIVVEAKDLQEAINKFEALEKPNDLPFNPVMKKYKEEVKINVVEEDDNRRHSKLKVK
jgi:hypothetical protein